MGNYVGIVHTLESIEVEDQQLVCLIQDNFLTQHGNNQRSKRIIFSSVFAERIC